MSTFEDEGLNEIEQLEAEISRLVAMDPALRQQQQQVRAAYTVAESLDYLLSLVQMSPQQLIAHADMPDEVAKAALSASGDTPVTLETLAALVETAGFRFELQFIPDAIAGQRIRKSQLEAGEVVTSRRRQKLYSPAENRNESNTVESRQRAVTLNGNSNDVVEGGILLKFPSPFTFSEGRSVLQRGLRKVARRNRHRSAIECVRPDEADAEIQLWKLFEFSDCKGFKLQFRFAFSNNFIFASDDEETAGYRALELGYMQFGNNGNLGEGGRSSFAHSVLLTVGNW